MVRRLLYLVVLTVGLVACAERPERVLPEAVQKAWEQFLARPDEATYLGFIQVNRAAARQHPYVDDARGVLHQLLALEVQSQHASRTRDLRLAESVVTRVDEIAAGGVIDVYDEVVPGARTRLLAARDRIAGLLE